MRILAYSEEAIAAGTLPRSEEDLIQPDLSAWENVPIRVGTRKSQLAMIQTTTVIDQIQKLYPQVKCEIIQMTTTGDMNLDVALSKIGDKSLFTKELEQALLKGEVDFVVHSLKDLPTVLPEGLTIAAITQREDPRDALVLPEGKKMPLDEHEHEVRPSCAFPEGGVIGTSSSRRVAAIRAMCPNWQVLDIRGNVNTRLQKLDAPNSPYSAIILAAAGLKRMGLGHRISAYLDKDSDEISWPYAVGQGALGLECAESSPNVAALLRKLNHDNTYYAVLAERALLYTFGGGCSIPLGVRTSFKHIQPEVDATEGAKYYLNIEAFHFGDNKISKESSGLKLPSDDSCVEIDKELTGIQPIICKGFPFFTCKLVAQLGLQVGKLLKGVDDTKKYGASGDGTERGDGDGLKFMTTITVTSDSSGDSGQLLEKLVI